MTFTELEVVLMIATVALVFIYYTLLVDYRHHKLKTALLLRAIAEKKAVVSMEGDNIRIEPTRS